MSGAPSPARLRSAGRGAVFTPAPLARRLAAELIAGLLRDAPQAPVAVLDPACGDGELLLAALAELARHGSAREALRGLHGIELDPELARRARARLARAAGLAPDERETRELERRIVCGDALDPRLAWPKGAAVLANPPWVSFSGRHAARLDPDRRRLYRESWEAFGGWPSLHGAFLERIAGHLAPTESRAGGSLQAGDSAGGRARVLVPAAVCEQKSYGPTRRAVTRHAELELPPIDLGERAFVGVTEPAVLLHLTASPRRGRRLPSDRPWPVRGEHEARLLTRLAEFPRLPAGSFADPGVHTGNAAAQLILRAVPSAEVRLEPLREGRDLSAFRLAAPRLWLRTDLERSPERRFRIAATQHYRSFPVLLRQTADRPLAALHEAPGAFRNSLLACRHVEGLDPAFVVAVLNAPVACAWHRLRFRDARQRAFPQVKVGHLATQPMPIASRDADPGLHDRVVAAVRALRPGHPAFAESVVALDETLLAAFALPREEARQVRELARGRAV